MSSMNRLADLLSRQETLMPVATESSLAAQETTLTIFSLNKLKKIHHHLNKLRPELVRDGLSTKECDDAIEEINTVLER